jgi:tetratricopeptide (TPR) repeat protein
VNLLSIALAVLVSVDASTVAPLAPPPAPAAQQTLPAMLARIDELYRRRDDRAAWSEEQRLAQAALARAPQDYGALWRAARVYFWMSDDPGLPSDQRSKLGKDGWDVAERAIAANPNDVAGYYFAAVCMGNYALGLGIMKALSKGLEGKFRERLGQAERLGPRYEHGAIDVAWGRFYDKLPWPKRDRKKAEEHYRRALQIDANNLRARAYLASSYLDDDRAPEAKPLLDEVNAAPLGRYDTPEERRAKAVAAALMPALYAKLK